MIAYVGCDCNIAIGGVVARGNFDGEGFFAALDSQRQSKRLTWKKVAQEAGVSASTLTRMAQGKLPDVNTMTALLAWSGLKAENFVAGICRRQNAEPLANIIAFLRADTHLSPESASVIEAIIRVAYEKLRKD